MKLKIENLDKELGPQKTRVLRNVSFEINEGEFCALMGKSGSGKSTLLYILSTLDCPTRGGVFYGDQDIAKMPAKDLHRLRNEKIGFVFQFHYLLPELSALENVLMPPRKAGLVAQKRAKALDLLETMGLKDRLHHRPRELSGGQNQRVAIARALIMDPAFLFADEPTGSLDSASTAGVFGIFRQINQERRTTIVMVTHDTELSQATQRQIRLVDGEVA